MPGAQRLINKLSEMTVPIDFRQSVVHYELRE